MVKDISELPRRINEAFKIATSGRPGPVLIDLPKDITAGILRHPILVKSITPGSTPGIPPPSARLGVHQDAGDEALISAAAEMINNAKKPIVYCGNGVLSSDRGPELLELLSKNGNIPVCTTFQGLGAFDEQIEDRALHMLGMHGSAYANLAMQEADVIIALGARFDDRVTGKIDTFAPGAKAAAAAGTGGIIHFEIQPKNINKVVEATIPVLGDVVASMEALVPQIEYSPREDWFAQVKEWKTKYPFTYVPSKDGARMKPQEVVEELDRQAEAIGSEFTLALS